MGTPFQYNQCDQKWFYETIIGKDMHQPRAPSDKYLCV